MPWKKVKCPTCPGLRNYDAKQCRKCADAARSAAKPSALLQADREKQRVQEELSGLRRKYDESLKTIDQQARELKAVAHLGDGVDTFKIDPRHGSGTSEGVPVLVASDWHAEERVKPGIVSGLNEFNPEIAKARAVRFFQSGVRLIRLLAQDITINKAVVAMLGDFFSNDIHEEFPEINAMEPMHAVQFAQSLLVSGIEFMLNHTKLDLVIPCHSGNHARTTRTTRFGAENGHSLEYLMYLHMAAYFRNEKRVTFIIPEGPHSYLDVYDETIRFHHGHMIKYAGGIGGIFIPAFKAIAQWNKAHHADLDVFGHFHQCKDGGSFVSNGSLIGYNAFALSIKADYERPRQQMFLMDKKRGRTCTWPILLTD